MFYRFDNYTLDLSTRTLRHGEALIELTPKVFQTLLVLVENHDRVISKDELFHIIWPDQFVEESNLSQNISVLRKVLGEATSDKKYIATFPGRGYRFIEPVILNRCSEGNHNGDCLSEVAVNEAMAKTPYLVNASSPSHDHSWANLGRLKYLVALFYGLFIFCSGIILYKATPFLKPQAIFGGSEEVKTFSRMDGASYQPSWSMDGKRLAFVYSNRDNAHSFIYVQSINDIQAHRVAYGTGIYSSPVWSPDGRFLAYLHMQPNFAEIVIFDITSGTTRQLTTLFPHRYGLNCRHLDWSPDGRFLVVDDKSVESEPLSLYLTYISNGNKVRLTYPSMDIIGDVAPRISPDGTQVAFVRYKYQLQRDVYVVSINGGEPRRLTEPSALVSDVGWETNHSLVFSAKRNDTFRLWRLDLRSPHAQWKLASSMISELPLQFSIARGSHQVAFSAYRPNLNIWTVDISRKPILVTDWKPVIHTLGEDVEPSVSRDGTKLAFRSDVSGRMQIWVSRIDGSDPFKVDTGTFIPAEYCWSPDSKSIVFSTILTHGLYGVSLSGEHTVRKLTTFLSHPSYSSDGKWLFARTHLSIYRIPIRGGAVEKVAEQGGKPIAQSKDGRYLYFGQGRMASTIARIDLSTGRQDIVVHSLMPGYSESWALTSRGIIFLGEQSGRPVIMFFDIKTDREQRISDFIGGLPPVGLSGFAISPDQHHLFVVRADPAFASIRTTMLTRMAQH
jgi:Tol biopolymer transport system component